MAGARKFVPTQSAVLSRFVSTASAKASRMQASRWRCSRISISRLRSRRSWLYSVPPAPARAPCSILFRHRQARPRTGLFCGAASDEFNDWCAISYMFQDDRLLPWRTAIRNVEFALEAGSLPKAERARRSHEVLELVDLRGFEEAFPYQLSGGMRSRVALAPSCYTAPRILLMDEPFRDSTRKHERSCMPSCYASIHSSALRRLYL